MKLLIIRHGDPNYAIDGLTDKGKIEAELLAERLEDENIKAIYCSTYGRAMRTAEYTLDRLGIEAEYCDWLREFNYERIRVPYLDKDKIAWDLLPEFVDKYPELYHPTLWQTVDFLKDTGVPEAYKSVCEGFDTMLLKHGYKRDGFSYKVIKPSHDTVVLFCHYGVTALLMSHIMNCSPYSLWQHTITLPTAVTTLYTEERIEGIASFRASSIGDLSHLFAGKEPASLSGRFCECFSDDTRH